MDIYTEQLFDKGVELIQQGWTPRGVALLERALGRHPEDHQLLLRVATQYESNGALQDAARSYRRLGTIFDGMGHPEKAWTLRDRADRIDGAIGSLSAGRSPIEDTHDIEPADTILYTLRPTPARSIGLLAFCLGALFVIFPMSVPEVSAELSDRAAAQQSHGPPDLHVSRLYG